MSSNDSKKKVTMPYRDEMEDAIEECIDEIEKFRLLLKGETDLDFIKDLEDQISYCEDLVRRGAELLPELEEYDGEYDGEIFSIGELQNMLYRYLG